MDQEAAMNGTFSVETDVSAEEDNLENELYYDINVNNEDHTSGNVVIRSIGTEAALYVKGTINPDLYPQNVVRPTLQIVWDTGSFATVLSKRVYDELPDGARPTLDRSQMHVTSASGAMINYYGKGDVLLEMAGKQFPVTMLVCDIDEDAILGNDFIWGRHSVSLQVDAISRRNRSNRQRKLYVIDPNTPEEHRVPLQQYRQMRNAVRMVTNRTVYIRPGEQMIVPLYSRTALLNGETYMTTNPIVEEDENLTHVTVVPSLVVAKNNQVPVRLINAGETTAKLIPGEQLAQCTRMKNYYVSEPIKAPEDDCSADAELSPEVVKKLKRKHRTKVHRIRSKGLDEDPNLQELPEHLRDLYKRSSQHLTVTQKHELKEMLSAQRDAFAKDGIGFTHLVKHDIDTGEEPPIRQRVRHPQLAMREVESKLVDEMIQEDVIEPSNSPWASPVVLVKKKDGSTRFCIDYRKLNAVTIKDAYPIPNMNACLSTLSGAKYFCTMDLKSGFWQVGLTERAKEKSAFVCSKGLFQWKVMPFGLCNAPPTFERLMETVLRGLQWEICLVYLDDIIIFGKTFNETLARLKTVISAIKRAGLKFKAKKCSLFQKSVQFLGHVVSSDGIATDPEKVKEIQNWPRPEEGLKLGNRKIPFVTQVRSFLGVCSYYRKFIPSYAQLSEPIQKYTRDETDTTWTPEAEKAFNTLKQMLTTAPILKYPELNKPFILDTDACDFAMGAVLSQEGGDGKEHPIAYMSKIFSKPERNYCIWRKEFQAVYKAVKNFDYYLRNQKVLVRTDNSAVVAMMKREWSNPQTVHMIAFLGQYDLKVEHRRGKNHLVPDGLSRKPEIADAIDKHSCNQCFPIKKYEQMKTQFRDQETQTAQTVPIQRVTTRSQLADRPNQLADVELESLTLQDIVDETRSDPNLSQLIQEKQDSINRPEWKEISSRAYDYKVLWGSWDQCFVKDSLLYRRKPRPPDSVTDKIQLILPKKLRRQAFDCLHGTAFGGHLGERKTLGKIKQRFYWPRLSTDVKLWVQQCDTCHANKPLLRRTHGRLHTHVMGLPGERAAADVGGPLPVTPRGNRYVLVVGDYFTKWIEAIPVPNQTAETLARAILEHYITKFGVPLSLHTDQGRSFESALWKELCTILGMKKTRTTPYRPQSDGYIERFNRTLWHMLRTCTEERKDDWDDVIPILAMAYRSAVNEVTGQTPNMLMLGREIHLPIDLALPSEPVITTIPEYVSQLRENMELVYEQVRKKTNWEVKRRKERYDTTAIATRLKPGDKVWYNISQLKDANNPSRKLRRRRRGPYLVVKKISDVTFIMAKSRDVQVAVHVDHIHKYRGPKQPRWMKPYLLQMQEVSRTSSVGCDTSDL